MNDVSEEAFIAALLKDLDEEFLKPDLSPAHNDFIFKMENVLKMRKSFLEEAKTHSKPS